MTTNPPVRSVGAMLTDTVSQMVFNRKAVIWETTYLRMPLPSKSERF